MSEDDETGDETGDGTRVPNAGTLSTRRLEAFTDGVFAIAATLLVLDLSVDKLGLGANPTSAQVWIALANDWLDLLSFGLSFFLLALLWTVHMRQFEYIDRIDGVMNTLNILRLFGVVLVPFTTTFNDALSDTVPGRLLLPLNFFYLIVLGTIMWFYVTDRTRGMLVPGVSDEYIRESRRNSIVSSGVAALVCVLAPFVGSLAFLLFFISSFLNGATRRRYPRPAKRTRARR